MNERQRRSDWPWIVGLTVGMPIFYAISVGLMIWLHDNGYIPEGIVLHELGILYVPITWSCENSKTINSAVGWYLSHWE